MKKRIFVRGVALIGCVAAVQSQAGNATDAYVQSGLVAAFDGIDNAGTGAHDRTATVWADLSGNGNNGTCDSKLSWNGSNGWSVSGDCKPVVLGNAIARTMATTNFTVNIACKPALIDKRMAYFSQYNGGGASGAASIEHVKTSGKLRLFRTKHSSENNNFDWQSNAKAEASSFISFALTVAPNECCFYKNGALGDKKTTSFGEAKADTESVIGGEVQRSGRTSADFTSGYGITFQGTYNALRIYNRALTADEAAWNSGLDAVRFNGADAAATLGEGYAYDAATDALTLSVSASAGSGGAVSVNGGEAGASAAAALAPGGVAVFAAEPDGLGGYVFDRWTGDTSAITTGTILTPEITVAATRPVALVANFRRNGDAADGLKFDLSFTGDATADGVVFSPTASETKQGYETIDVPLPVLPTVTNDAVKCIYLPQPADTSAKTVFRQDARVKNVAVGGEVATVFCRFRWDGSVLPDEVNYPAVVMNGYESWNNASSEGFCLRLRAEKNDTRGSFSFVFAGNAVAYNNSGITTTGAGYIDAGRWVDVFASVYPSPTNPKLSNADVWYCEVPSWNALGYFNRSEMNHKHFGDACGIERINTTKRTVIFGSEPNAGVDAVSKVNGVKCLRGAIACAKGWNRLLSENEMWTVMADLGGVQSFADLDTAAGRTYKTLDDIDTEDFREGRNGTQISFLGGDDQGAHRWRALTKTYHTNTLLWNAPKDRAPMPVVYSTRISNAASGKTQPCHLEVNGSTVWRSDGVKKDEEIVVKIGAEHTLPGLNELKWVYDTEEASNWMIFRYHQLKIRIDAGLLVIIR